MSERDAEAGEEARSNPSVVGIRRRLGGGLERWFGNRAVVWAGVSFMGMILIILILPGLLGVEANRLSEEQFAGPSWAHWLGTDANGRDLLARVCAGARVSLVVGLAGAMVSVAIGVGWGAVAGYLGGRWDGVMMRTVDVLYSLPSILFVIVLLTVMQGPVVRWLEAIAGGRGAEMASILFLVIGLGGVSWLTMARIVRAQVMSLRRRPFMDAARALGAGHARLIFRHLLPNTLGVIFVYLTLTIPAIVLGESFLSYLGLGVQPPQASLGTLLADGAGQINPLRTAWLPLVGPGGVMVALLLALSFLGDGMREALDPKSRR